MDAKNRQITNLKNTDFGVIIGKVNDDVAVNELTL